MRISWNWLSELVDLTGVNGPSALADLLTSRGLEVEGIERLDQGFEKVVTAQILERNPHPQADRLSLCRVTIGSGEPLEIVCGAQNMKAGDKVVLAQVGAHLPNGVKIAAGKIRGVVSNGMLCSEEELKLKDSSEGILILDPSVELGLPLAKVLGRDDVVLALKLTSNRGDCLSHLGIAREVAAALHKPVKKPEAESFSYNYSGISIQLDAGDHAPQFCGGIVRGVKIGPSPEWLVKRLASVGSRSINNVVDATNLVMLELGHPMHAYDLHKLAGSTADSAKIQVRVAKEGEELPLLDGSSVKLAGFELVISDSEKAVGLAGVMGGSNSEVSDTTQDLFLECAEFDPILVRKASIKHQKKTDAAHRFERGVDPQGLQFAMNRLTTLIVELAGGQVVGHQIQQRQSRKGDAPARAVRFSKYYLSDFLGFERDSAALSLEKTKAILEALECRAVFAGESWVVTPPSYRLDLNIREDIAEEVARSLGYDAIPSTIPKLTSSPVFGLSSLSKMAVMDRAKESLSRSGLSETVNFAFTSQAWLSQFGMTSAVRVSNPLSEEHEFMVPSLLPGLVKNTLNNWNHHFGSEPLPVRLFELRPTFATATDVPVRAEGQMQTGVIENWKLAFVISGPRFAEALRSERGEVDFYDVKAVMDQLLGQLGCRGVRFLPMTASRAPSALYHPGQSVEILAGNTVIGAFGLMHPELGKDLKTRTSLWIGEMDWDGLTRLARTAAAVPTFKSWPEFPSMERDFALVVKSDVTSDKICQLAMKAGKPLAKGAKVFDIYRGSQVAEGMTSIAVRVIFYEEGRSLQESEAEAASARILEAWKKEIGAELRG